MKELRTRKSHIFGVKHAMVLIGFLKTVYILSFKKETGSSTDILEPMEKLLPALLTVSQNLTISISIEINLTYLLSDTPLSKM